MSSRIRRLDYIALSGISEINLGDNIAEITLAEMLTIKGFGGQRSYQLPLPKWYTGLS